MKNEICTGDRKMNRAKNPLGLFNEVEMRGSRKPFK